MNLNMDEFYAGKTILVTGATGFIGKVLIEKILRCLPSVEKIYVLARAKNKRLPQERIRTILQLPIFERIRNEHPESQKKIAAIAGDLFVEELGIFIDDIDKLLNEVNVVFHLGANTSLKSKMKDSVIENTAGTKYLLDFCSRMKKLTAFVHVSTAYCHGDVSVLEERIYEPLRDPHEVIELVKNNNYKSLEKMQDSLMKPHPNFYSFSKRLAENVVASYHPRLPVLIIRPSIVTPALKEPMPGWVDSSNGPIGVMAAFGKGVARSLLFNGENRPEVIPVDVCVNSILVAGKYCSENSNFAEIPVRNATPPKEASLCTWNQVLDCERELINLYPFEQTVWHPNGKVRSDPWMHKLLVLLFQKLPALFIDLVLSMFMQKQFMVRLQEKISDDLQIMQYLTMKEWRFENAKCLNFLHYLSKGDQEIFFLTNVESNLSDYLTACMLGARQYCLNENSDSIPYWRSALRMLYMLDRATKFLFVFIFMYFALLLLSKILY